MSLTKNGHVEKVPTQAVRDKQREQVIEDYSGLLHRFEHEKEQPHTPSDIIQRGKHHQHGDDHTGK